MARSMIHLLHVMRCCRRFLLLTLFTPSCEGSLKGRRCGDRSHQNRSANGSSSSFHSTSPRMVPNVQMGTSFIILPRSEQRNRAERSAQSNGRSTCARFRFSAFSKLPVHCNRAHSIGRDQVRVGETRFHHYRAIGGNLREQELNRNPGRHGRVDEPSRRIRHNERGSPARGLTRVRKRFRTVRISSVRFSDAVAD